MKKSFAPVLFIGHGSPLNVVADNAFTRRLAALGASLPRPEAVLVVSAHWLGEGVRFTAMERPRTIHDFYGFPEELYKVEWPCPGSPELAKTAARLLNASDEALDFSWGLDHAAWAVLKHLLPSPEIPVVEMSLNYSFREASPKPLSWHFDLASKLKPLRERGVLILCSGNIVHNLESVDFENVDAEPFDWAVEFDRKFADALERRDFASLLDLSSFGSCAKLAVPTLDHYLPAVCALGLADETDDVSVVFQGFQNASISMTAFRIG